MPSLDTETMTQHLAHFDRLNMGYPVFLFRPEVDRAI